MKKNAFGFKTVLASDPDNLSLTLRGAGTKGLGLFINAEDDLPPAQQMLGNILRAIGLNMEQDACTFICPARTPVHLPSLIRQHNLKYILLFQVDPGQCGIRFALPQNHPIEHHDVIYLLTHALMELEQEREQGGKAKRGALWQALKLLFPTSSGK